MTSLSLSSSQLDALVAAAVAAPSADNRHVFRVEPRPDGLRLLATDEFLKARGSRRVLGLISLGAVVENMAIQAAGVGVRLDADWRLDGGVVADVVATVATPAPDPLAPAIAARHTNRRVRFTGPRLSAPERHLLDADAAAIPGAGVAWFDEPPARGRALGLIRRAESERFRNEELHRELFESLRFDVGWHASATEGLPAGSLALPVVERPAFLAMRHWPVQRAVNRVGAAAFVGWRAADLPCRLAPHLGAITASGPPEAAAIAAGRALQRVWLRATLSGLAFQVFAASPLYALDGSTAIASNLRAELAAGWAALCGGARPFVVVRMGHAALPSVRAGRPDPRSLMCGDGVSKSFTAVGGQRWQ